jgi:hypothetical protein
VVADNSGELYMGVFFIEISGILLDGTDEELDGFERVGVVKLLV